MGIIEWNQLQQQNNNAFVGCQLSIEWVQLQLLGGGLIANEFTMKMCVCVYGRNRQNKMITRKPK